MPIAFLAGTLCLVLPIVLPAPPGMTDQAWAAAGLAGLMAVFWLTEALPLAATALIPLALGPVLGLGGMAQIAPSYANPLIFLFLGGFLLAKAIEKWRLHRRIALALLSRAGKTQAGVLAALMGTTAFLSLWISNTASAMVIAPIAAAIAAGSEGDRRFQTALMLGVAFAATIGGMGTLIGTPPNAIFAAYVSDTYGIDIGFARWAAIGIPVSATLLVTAWVVLSRISPGAGSAPVSPPDFDLAPMTSGEKRVGIVAALTALAWITRPLADAALPGLQISDAGIAMLAAVLLFALPSGQGGRLLDWGCASTLRWDVLILFGGGLALAGLLESSGLAAWIGTQAVALNGLPAILLTLVIAALIVYIGELASNTAMAAIFLPVAGASAAALGADPVLFMLPVALAASIGFMLPVATPPNAIVFSHPSVERPDMLRPGAILDVLGIVVAVGLSTLLGPVFF